MSKTILLKRGKCKDCKYWVEYSNSIKMCSFYDSMPTITHKNDWCKVDNHTSFGFKKNKH